MLIIYYILHILYVSKLFICNIKNSIIYIVIEIIFLFFTANAFLDWIFI